MRGKGLNESKATDQNPKNQDSEDHDQPIREQHSSEQNAFERGGVLVEPSTPSSSGRVKMMWKECS